MNYEDRTIVHLGDVFVCVTNARSEVRWTDAIRAHTHTHTQYVQWAVLLAYSLLCCCCCHLLTFKALINVVCCGMWHVGAF